MGFCSGVVSRVQNIKKKKKQPLEKIQSYDQGLLCGAPKLVK